VPGRRCSLVPTMHNTLIHAPSHREWACLPPRVSFAAARPGAHETYGGNHGRSDPENGQISVGASRTGSVRAAFCLRNAQVGFRSPPARPTDSTNRSEPAAWAHAALRFATQPAKSRVARNRRRGPTRAYPARLNHRDASLRPEPVLAEFSQDAVQVSDRCEVDHDSPLA
jgi:hypothetical protein